MRRLLETAGDIFDALMGLLKDSQLIGRVTEEIAHVSFKRPVRSPRAEEPLDCGKRTAHHPPPQELAADATERRRNAKYAARSGARGHPGVSYRPRLRASA
ncbi:hypothetical protein [Accumulibacter sp.]|uniref:hypothetical protein n=1 Tax=Accumulibacter sp. TaxID=2053492 RepID=UPI0035B1AC64